MMESDSFLFDKPLLMVAIFSSTLNVSQDWLNSFGFKVLILRLPRVQQVIIRNFLWKNLAEDIADLSVK